MNYREASEISPEDLEAAAELYDKLIAGSKTNNGEGSKSAGNQKTELNKKGCECSADINNE